MSKQVLRVMKNPAVALKFQTYPKTVRRKMETLRKLILDSAAAIEHINEIEETLKWGEPSYLAKKGSTIRIDWKEKAPDQYAMYFKCTCKLVPTFKEVYGNLFNYENNRAIVFGLDDRIPEKELKECIRMTLKYHLLKGKARLGM